jgi:hypothetical protein
VLKERASTPGKLIATLVNDHNHTICCDNFIVLVVIDTFVVTRYRSMVDRIAGRASNNPGSVLLAMIFDIDTDF